ncbi:MAG: hypothetical protein ACFFBF_05095 [Promethearchaeota archaeon]
MRINKKMSSGLITIILVFLILGFALARTEDFNDFSGEGHGSCHGNITQSTTGYITLLSSSGTTINPSETFTVSIQIISFTEAQGNNIEAGFPSGSPGRADNKDFIFVTTQQSVSIDSSGNSIVLNFQVTAPSVEQTYTLHADAIYRAGGSASYFTHGDLILNVQVQNLPPQFNNLLESSDPLELGGQETFQIDVIDAETSVDTVLIELEGNNYTMSNIGSNTYEFNWTPNTIGIKSYKIYANDTDGSWNSIIGNINVIDTTVPAFSNLIESADPLELGQTETIQINVSDLSGISSVLIELNNVNNTMTKIGSSTWEYNSWIPISMGLKSYTIYANDIEGNWNSISSDITVIDTIAPKYDFLIESADPLPLGNNETITITVYDSPGSGVKDVFLEYNNVNHTMIFIGSNTWRWSQWKPASIGIYNYSIYMIDNNNNLNMTIGSIEVILSSGPIIQNLSKSAESVELGQPETIQVDIEDADGVSKVFFEIGGINHTMVKVGANRYEYTWTPISTGIKVFKILANDSLNNWNQISDNILVLDTTPPIFENLTESSDPLELGNSVMISIDAKDFSGINQVKIEFEGVNHSMSYIGGNTWLYDTWKPSIVDMHTYTIYIKDNSNIWNSTSGFIETIDTIAPKLSNLYENYDPLEIGQTAIIQINATDFSIITLVSIEIDGSNYTMTNIGGTIWQYNTWIPQSVGIKNYSIYAKDSNENYNSINNNLTVIDTIGPKLTNLIEITDPLELGNTPIIQVDVTDFSPITLVLLEIEEINYTMTFSGGFTWQSNIWTSNNTGLKIYEIFAFDSINNIGSLKDNITIKDMTGPNFYNLVKSEEFITLGQSVSIQVQLIDFSGVSEVFIEFEGFNHTMVNILGDTWEYINWTPSNTGELFFTIHAKDINNNWNSYLESIMVTDKSTNINPLIIIETNELIIYSSTIGIIVVGIVLIVRTSKKKRFIP